jgi:predicted RND superfamily exporter protein
MEEKKLKSLLKWAFIICLTLSHVFAFNLLNLKFDYSFENFFPSENSETKYFRQFRDKFGTDNDYILIAVENDEGVFQKDFLDGIKSFSNEVDSLPLVKMTMSLTNQDERTVRSGFNIKQPYYSGEDSLLTKDSLRIFSHDELIQSFISKDAKSVCLFVAHEQFMSKPKCDSLVAQIKELIGTHDFDKTHLTGRAPGQSFYTDSMQFEMILLSILSFILILVFLAFTYKSFWGVWVSLVIITTSILWVLGSIALFGESLNLTMTILPSIIFVVATSDVIHLVSKYIENLREGLEKTQAIIKAYKDVGIATLLTSVTTAAGFLSLLVIDIEPIQNFGKYAALGVLVAFVLAYTLLPALLYMTKPPKRMLAQKQNDTFWTRVLYKSFPIVLKKPKLIFGVSILLIGLAGAGLYQLEVNNYILDDLEEDAPLKQDFVFMDHHFGGVRPFELGIQLKDTVNYSIHDEVVMNEIQKVEDYLTHEYGVENFLSMNKTLLLAHRTFTGNIDTSIVQIPQKKREKYIRMLRKKGDLLYARFVNNNLTRVSGQLENIGSIESQKRNDKLDAFIIANINQDILEFHPTGTSHLTDYNMSFMSESLISGLLIALLVVSVLMGVLFKSFKTVLISLIPNCLPLLIIAGWMGFFDIDIKFTTAIIFTIAFGIAVDDTIHFMSKFRMELKKGRSKLYALKRTYLSTGRAIILTSIILIAGFLLLVFSSFKGTYYVGTLISLALIFAVLADLFLLPALIVWFYKKK